MKKVCFIGSGLLLLLWVLGYFVFHAGPSIHALIGLCILAALHAIICNDSTMTISTKSLFNLKYYSRLFRKEQSSNTDELEERMEGK